MDATQIINQHVNYNTLLEHYNFQEVKQEGGMLRACCKLHDGKNGTGFVLNEENGLWFCHTGDCGGGDLYTLVQKLENCSFPSAIQHLAKMFNINISTATITHRSTKEERELRSYVKTMKRIKPPPPPKPYILEQDIKHLISFRNFKEETLNHFHTSFTPHFVTSTHTYLNRILCPVYFNNTLIAVSLRATRVSDTPKWVHQPHGVHTGEMLYNYDNAKFANSIIICEGIFDVWAWYEVGLTAVCTFGAHMSKEQYKLLMYTGADIVLSFDGDKAGLSATSAAEKLLHNKANLSFIHFHSGEDPESITREELKERYDNRRK